MLAIFAADLDLAGPPDEMWRRARAALRLAAGAPHGGWPPDLPGAEGAWTPGDGSALRWRTQEAEGVGRIWTLTLDDDVPGATGLRSRRTAHVAVDASTGHVQVLEALRTAGRAARPVPRAPVRADALVRAVLLRATVRDGVHPVLAEPVVVDRAGVAPASILATDPGRGLPVLLVAEEPATAARLAHDLAGTAHVLALEAAGGAELCRLLELPAPVPGEVTVLWPGWQLADDWPRRETWSRVRLAPQAEAPPHPAVAAIRSASVVRQVRLPLLGAVAEAAVRARVAEVADPGVAGDADRAAWAADLRALEAATKEALDLRDEVDRLSDERDDLVALLATRFDQDVARAVELRTGAVGSGPRSLGEALATASAELRHLEVLPEAIEQAHAWPFLQPAKVLDHLRLLDAIVGRWQRGELREGLHAAILHAGLPWARDVSATAHQRFPQDYRVRWEGRDVLLGPHLRYGAGPPTRQCRVYCAIRQDPRALLVGHVGSHLRGHRDH